MAGAAIGALVCLAAAYALGLAIYAVMGRRDALGVVAVGLACVGMAASLLIIPGEKVVWRAIAGLVIVDLFFRVIDFARQSWRAAKAIAGWGEYSRFLIPFPWLLAVFGQKKEALARGGEHGRHWGNAWRLALGICGAAVGVALLLAANQLAALQQSFWLDHVTKVFIFVITVESLAQGLCGLERLLGFDTRPPIDRGFLARTPAEFWQRYNNRVHGWLHWNVFLPCGGRRHPARGVWMAMLASAVLHEIAFGIALSQFTGYQFLFFLVQAPAILCSPALERFARARGVWGDVLVRGATVVWFGATSVLFFDGVDRVFPVVYAGGRWLW